jgi:ribosomal subunit interface protein
MELPLEVLYNGVKPSETMASRIQEQVGKLERICDRIIRCRVTVDEPAKHQKKGSTFHVTIDITLKGSEIVINRQGDNDPAHEHVYTALNDAFEAARRKLDSYVERRRQKGKHRAEPVLQEV